MLKNSRILSLKNFVLTLALLKLVKQSINSFISLVLVIINTKIVAKQLLGLVDLTRAKVFYIHEPI